MEPNVTGGSTNATRQMEHSFGFEATAGTTEKQTLLDGVFHSVARRYDLMNDLMSGGLLRVWKDILVTKARPPRRGNWRCLDMAGGTGDWPKRTTASEARTVFSRRH